jgi:cytolysin-activating lysine-acyltransferase
MPVEEVWRARSLGPGARNHAFIERTVFASPLSEIDEARVSSGVLFLCQFSRLHSRYPLEVLEHRICPALALGQFHFWADASGVPVAFCNWAWLSLSVLDQVLATGRDLLAHEFRSGDQPIFYELLAPFGHCWTVVRELRSLPFFKGRLIPSIRGERSEDPRQAPRVKYFKC